MGFKRKGRFLGIEMEGGEHLAQRKTCIYRKWEIIYFQPGNMCKVHFLKKVWTVTFRKLGGLDLERGFSI